MPQRDACSWAASKRRELVETTRAGRSAVRTPPCRCSNSSYSLLSDREIHDEGIGQQRRNLVKGVGHEVRGRDVVPRALQDLVQEGDELRRTVDDEDVVASFLRAILRKYRGQCHGRYP